MTTPATDRKQSAVGRTSLVSPTASADGHPEGNDMLSIVVPAYNEEQAVRGGLLGTIVSWKKAQPFPIELIVVDDGSEDATARVAEGIADRVIRIEHGGKAAALTAGIRAAAGEHGPADRHGSSYAH